MDERELQDSLRDLLESVSGMDDEDRADAGLDGLAEPFEDAVTRSFEESGVLTMNAGCTLRMADGSEYQLTVVRSK